MEAQRCVNIYAESILSGTGKGGEVAFYEGTPGLTELLTVGAGPIRCVHVDSKGRIFVVSGDTLYTISESGGTWSATECGADGDAGGTDFTLSTSTGRVKAASMSFLGDGSDSSTIFVDGTANYLYLEEVAQDYFGLLTSYGYGSVPLANEIVWSDGYFILNKAGTNTFYVSDLKSFNVDNLNFANSEGSPDVLRSLAVKNRNLYAFNDYTTEVYANTGNADFPFERVGGGFIEMGIAARNSLAQIGDHFFWLGQSKYGTGVVYKMRGLEPDRISTHAIEKAIAGYAAPGSATAFCYQDRGHYFYVLNFAEATWCYDLTTGLWHERAFTTQGVLSRHLADHYAFDKSHNYHIVGDVSSNEVYIFDRSVYTDDGSYITRLRTCPHLYQENKRIQYNSFELDMETGVGLDGSGQGSDPKVMLSFSDDGGHTYSNEILGSVGKMGNYGQRVKFNRLGMSRDRVFRIKMTDPVKCKWLGAELDIEMTGG